MMTTDSERREAARRLRGNPEDTLIPHRTGRNHGMGCHEAADRFWNMCDRIKEAGNYDIAFSTTSVLADLIEPSASATPTHLRRHTDASATVRVSQRGALLALADEMERMPQCELCPAEIVDCSAHPDGCPDALLDYYARRIRDALGVVDGQEP